jgi:hypothetical protein
LDLQVAFSDLQVTFFDLQVTFLDPQVAFLDLQVTFLDLQVTFLDLQVTFLDLRVTYLDLRVTFLDLQVTFSDLQVTFSDPRVTFPGPRVAFPASRVAFFIPQVDDLPSPHRGSGSRWHSLFLGLTPQATCRRPLRGDPKVGLEVCKRPGRDWGEDRRLGPRGDRKGIRDRLAVRPARPGSARGRCPGRGGPRSR